MKNLTKRRWLVLIASCLINLCIGSLYAWSVFATPMAEHISKVQGLTGDTVITAGSLAIVFSVANMLGPITMIGGGKLIARFGPRPVILIGGIWFGIGMLLSGFSNSVPLLVFGFGICCGLAVGMTYGCTVSNCVRFFPDRRGLAGGLTTASYGLSSVIVPLIASAIISKTNVTSAFKLLGIAMMIIICLASLLVLPCPDGFLPEGYKPAAGKPQEAVGKDYTWKEMLKVPAFYVMICMLCCGAFMGMMVISQASPIAQSQIKMTAQSAAVVVSVLALFNAGGRILGGIISDRIGQINTLTILLGCSVIGLLLLVLAKEGAVAVFCAGICVVGLCFGGFMGIYPGFTNERFGAKYSGVNYGIMFIGFAVSGFFAPLLIGKIFSAMGVYTAAYLAAMGLSAIGLVLAFIYRKCR